MTHRRFTGNSLATHRRLTGDSLAAHRRLTGDIEFFNGNTPFQLQGTHRRPTTDFEEKLKLVQLFFFCGACDLEKFIWKHDCGRSPVGRRWVASSFRSLIDVSTTKNDYHYNFALEFSTEESSSPVGHR